MKKMEDKGWHKISVIVIHFQDIFRVLNILCGSYRYCMSILQNKWKEMVKNWWRNLKGYGVTWDFCEINALSYIYFTFKIITYFIWLIWAITYLFCKKKWRETVKNSWNRTVSAIVTLVTVWPYVTGSGCYYHVPSVLPRYLVFHHHNDKTL